MKLDSAIFFTNNLTRAIDFYCSTIGLEMEYRQEDRYASFVFENGVRLGIKSPTETREAPGSQTLFIATDNIEEPYQKMQSKGINLYTELKTKAYGREFSILDPDGNKLLFIQRL